MKPFSCAVVFAAGVAMMCVSLNGASADTVTYTQDITDFTTLSLPGSSFNPLPASSVLTSTNVFGESPDIYRSPFENASGGSGGALLSDGGYGVGTWANLQYTSIQAGGSATYNFASGATGLSLLWGSPDSYNTLTFFSGLNGTGTDLFSITGSQLAIQTYGHDLVDFTMAGADFESVVLTTSSNAFEFADLQDAPVAPIPATLPLFAAGLGMVCLLARRKRQQGLAATI